jgi:hypothetical protein
MPRQLDFGQLPFRAYIRGEKVMERMELTATTAKHPDATESSKMRKIIFGSSLGRAFEWYEFFVFGTLAVILGPLFFSKALGETGAFLAKLATYCARLVQRHSVRSLLESRGMLRAAR